MFSLQGTSSHPLIPINRPTQRPHVNTPPSHVTTAKPNHLPFVSKSSTSKPAVPDPTARPEPKPQTRPPLSYRPPLTYRPHTTQKPGRVK